MKLRSNAANVVDAGMCEALLSERIEPGLPDFVRDG